VRLIGIIAQTNQPLKGDLQCFHIRLNASLATCKDSTLQEFPFKQDIQTICEFFLDKNLKYIKKQ
jgi:hypothetical protein